MSIRPFKDQHPDIHASVMVDEQCTVIGNVNIGADSSVWPHASIRGDVQSIRIGERTSIQDGCSLHVTHRGAYTGNGAALHIGDDVTVGHNATLHGCTIGNKVLIGMGSIVLDKAIVEDLVMLGAGSLVPPGKTLESGFLYAGSPAKQRRPLTDNELSLLGYMASNYVNLKNTYLEAEA